MSKRGRKGTPIELVIARGNPGKRAIPQVPPVTPIQSLAPPDLSGDALKWWNYYAPLLDTSGVLSQESAPALADLCRAIARRDLAEQQLKAEGYVWIGVDHKGNQVQRVSKWAGLLKQAEAQVNFLRAQFGLMPASRRDLAKPKQTSGDPDREKLKKEIFG